MLCSTISLITSLLLMAVCAYHWYVLREVNKCGDIRKMRTAMRKAKKALQCAKWSAVELAVIATQAGMTLEQVEEEYCKDALARKEVLMSTLGGRKNAFVRKFLQNYPSRFLRNGYSLEKYFTHAEGSKDGGPQIAHRHRNF